MNLERMTLSQLQLYVLCCRTKSAIARRRYAVAHKEYEIAHLKVLQYTVKLYQLRKELRALNYFNMS